MNYRIPVLILCLFLVACKTEPPIEFYELWLDQDQLAGCDSELCPDISINTLEMAGESKLAQTVNQQVRDYIIQALNIGEDETPSAETIEEAAYQFTEIYREHKAEYFDMTAEYEVGIEVRQAYMSKELISLQIDQYMYTGGAHGFSKTDFLNLDPKDGEILTADDLISDTEGFRALAEELFREKFEIAAGESINVPGFWFEEDEFQLSEAFGVSEAWVVLYYNPYEIAPYSEGIIELQIPLDQAKKYLAISID